MCGGFGKPAGWFENSRGKPLVCRTPSSDFGCRRSRSKNTRRRGATGGRRGEGETLWCARMCWLERESRRGVGEDAGEGRNRRRRRVAAAEDADAAEDEGVDAGVDAGGGRGRRRNLWRCEWTCERRGGRTMRWCFELCSTRARETRTRRRTRRRRRARARKRWRKWGCRGARDVYH